jgi:hypothetical protein
MQIEPMKTEDMSTYRTTRIAEAGAITHRVADGVRVETAAAACEGRQR